MRRAWPAALSGVLAVSLLAACQDDGDEGGLKKLGKDEQVTIKVMDWDETAFFQNYGSLFISQFPNIDVEVAGVQPIYSQGATPETLRKFIDENKPDVLMLSPEQYEQLAEEGRLYELDSVISQDKFKLDGIAPGVLNLSRGKSDGKLYGLSPTFQSQALFYNIDLFQKYGVAPPGDSMTWEEVLALAERFPTDGGKDDRVYGFAMPSYSTPLQLVLWIARTEGLRMLNADATEATLTGGGWRRALQTAASAIRSGAVLAADPAHPEAGSGGQDPFLAGRAAMTLDYSYRALNIVNTGSAARGGQPLHWGLATAPVGSERRNVSAYVNVSRIYAVNAQSPHLRAAWEFVKYIAGENFAKASAHSLLNGELLARTAYIPEADGVSLEPFYKLASAEETSTGLEKAPDGFAQQIDQLLADGLDKLADGAETADEALRALQEQTQAALDTANLEHSGESG